MAAPIYYPDNTFHNEGAGNQFVDTSIVAENVVIGSKFLLTGPRNSFSRKSLFAAATGLGVSHITHHLG
jgi:hypothetical protein